MVREIGAHGHGKDVLYGLNARDKSFWGKKWTGYQNIIPQLLRVLV